MPVGGHPLPRCAPRFAILTSVQPLVSVVVPVFNGMPHLVALTNSLLAQTYPNLEIIFSEGGGSDSSGEYLHTIDDPRVRIISMPPGTSAAQNWTAATMAASGEFTKLICQDDLLSPKAIELQVQDLLDNPEAVMAIAQRDIVDARGNTLYRERGLAGLPTGADFVSGTDLIRTCYLQGTNVIGEPLAVLFRTKELQAAMPWQDENPLMLDLSMYQRVAPHHEVALRWGSVGAFRVSTSSWSTRIAQQQVEQTRQWQEEFARDATPPVTAAEQRRASWGRRKQTTLRRIAYAVLRAKGALRTETS